MAAMFEIFAKTFVDRLEAYVAMGSYLHCPLYVLEFSGLIAKREDLGLVSVC